MRRSAHTSDPVLRCLIAIAVCLTDLSIAYAQPLPPAPTLESLQGEWSDSEETQHLDLELVVNTMNSGRIVRVDRIRGDLFIKANELIAAGIDPKAAGYAADGETRVNLSALPGLQVHYDENLLQLQMFVPPSWLPAQDLRRHIGNAPDAQASLGALVNYDFYYDSGPTGSGVAALWTEQRLFDGFGLITNSGIVRVALSPQRFDGQGSDNGYIRQDSSWVWTQEDRLVTWTFGDSITGGTSWSDAVRIGGVRVARDFRIRPDLITYPLPQFAGQTAVPTTVDVFVNGNQVSRDDVRAGPFIVSNFPFISGAGDATVVTTDATGRQTQTTMPFYVTSEVLRKGLMDYSFSGGALREDYGVKNFAYRGWAGSGSMRYGVNDQLTAESQIEVSDGLSMLGLGAVTKVGQLGVFSFAGASNVQGGSQGWRWTYGYRYSNRYFNLSYQGTIRDGDFRDLALTDQPVNTSTRLRSNVLAASITLGREAGTIGFGFFDFDIGDGDSGHSQLFNVSYSKPLWHDANAFIGFNRDVRRGGSTFIVQVVVPFENWGHVNGTILNDGDGGMSERVGYSRSAPPSGGVGWELGYRNQDGQHDGDAAVSFNTRYTYLDGGVYTTDGQAAGWAGAHGSVLMMDGGLFVARQVNDAFVLVSTDGVPDVPVSFENQLVGTTDDRGHLLVPWVPSYYEGKYAIDTLGLSGGLRTPMVEQQIAVRRGSGALLRFPLEKVQAVLLTLVDAAGQPLPVGSAARERNNGLRAQVGYDGEIYFEGQLAKDNTLDVRLPNGTSCTAHFAFDVARTDIVRAGTITCQ